MRIALVVPGFSDSEQDWCIPVLLNLVRELAARHEVHVFALRYPHRRAIYKVHGATVHSFAGAQARGLERLPLLLRAISHIVAQGRRGSFDVIHGLWADEPGFLAVSAARVLRVPALVSLMGGELVAMPEIGYGGQLSRLSRLLIRWSLARAALVTAGSRSLQRLAQERAGPGRLELLPLGVDTRRFYPRASYAGASPLTAGELKLLHVASLSPVKDQTLLLRALTLALARLSGLHLHIVGDGPLEPELRHSAQQLGITGNLTFHGAVAHDRLPAYYNAADLCLLSSRFESQSMVVLEAAACGRSTVGTAVGLLPELAPAVAVVPVGDAHALAEALLAALEQRSELEKLGRAGLGLVEERYTVERTATRLVQLYASLGGG